MIGHRTAGGFIAVVAALALATDVAAATPMSALSWRATLVGAQLHGGATTLLQINGRGSINVKVSGVPAGQTVMVSIVVARCGASGQTLLSSPLTVDGSGTATGKVQLTAAEVAAYREAKNAARLLSVRATTNGDEACGNQAGAPSVGTNRLAATEANVATYDIRYPSIGGLSATSAAAVNMELSTAARSTVADFVAAARGALPLPGGVVSTARQTFAVTLALPSLLSVVEHYVPDVFGAPHGDEQFFTFTFNLATGHRILLTELFRGDGDWLAALSKAAIARLQPTMGSFAGAVAGPIATNFDAWRLAPGGLQITFAQAQGFSVPITTITIPWSALSNVLNPQSPIARLLPPA